MHTRDAKNRFFSIEIYKTTYEPRRSPSSLPHLIIEIENEFLTHFYSTKYEMRLRSGNELHPSRVLHIDPVKMLNNYYTPRV
jgi:hypothetical protein